MTATLPSGRIPLLGHFRARWVDSPYPMVVHTPAEGTMTLCAAPSLWMGARQVAHGLRAAGARPGQVVTCEADHGPLWVQTLVGAARAGCAFGPPGRAAHWRVDATLAVQADRPDRPAAEGVGLLRGATVAWHAWRAPELTETEAPPGPPGRPVHLPGAWSDHDTFFAHVLPALLAGAELHTTSV